MQPASKTKKRPTDADENEPPSKIQAMDVPEAESDSEYESVPKKSRKSSPPKAVAPVTIPTPIAVIGAPTTAEDEPMMDLSAVNDDDWLRNRTNRLLDLVDPDDLPPRQIQETTNVHVVTEAAEDNVMVGEQEASKEQDVAEEEAEKPDPALEAISSNGRLFVRNLPYTATEEDITHHFEQYGALDEVCIFLSLIVSLLPI
jgi:multiple RNA-binding domain-containing protein 1